MKNAAEPAIAQMSILIVDDNPVTREQITAFLAADGFTDLASMGSEPEVEMESWFGDRTVDLLLLDFTAPQGTDILKLFKSDASRYHIPVIILASAEDDEKIKTGFALGATDFIKKPLQNDIALLNCIKSALRQKLLCEKYNEHVMIDHLTGIYKRCYFNKILDKEYERAQRNRDQLTLMIVSIDQFEHLIDNHGKAAGDTILKLTAKLLESNLKRAGDHLFRLGDGELAAIFIAYAEDHAMMIAERVRERVKGLAPEQARIPGEIVTVSIGLVTIFNRKDISADTLIQTAYASLEQSRSDGGDKITEHFYFLH